jgi:membrane-associated phospholipid phosphatase
VQAQPRDALLAAGSFAVFAGITAGLAAGGPLLELDLAVHDWAQAHRPPAAETVARVLNRLGQGGWLLAICAVLAAWLGWRTSRHHPPAPTRSGTLPAVSGTSLEWHGRRPTMSPTSLKGVGPLLYVVAAAVLVVPTVLLIKRFTERGAPSSDLPAEQTVPLLGPLPPGEYAAGYPGGHAVNAVVWYGVLLLLVTALLGEYGRAQPPRPLRVAVRLVPPVVVLGTTTYLSFHWLTDSLAGLSLGLAIDRLLALLRHRW